MASGLVLAVLTIFALGFNPNFDLGDSGAPKNVESAVALRTLQKGLPAGATDPTTVLLHSTDGQPLTQDELTSYATELGKAQGVGQVSPGTLSDDQLTASFSVVLEEDPTSDQALADVKGPIRDAAHAAAPEGTEALVGGTTSVFVDFQKAMNRDYRVVFPVAAVVIMVILALLLRSLVAPIYLMASVVLGFGATLGAAVLVFQHIGGRPGLIFLLPIYIYLFVVALGTDYNILMIARLREEARAGADSHARGCRGPQARRTDRRGRRPDPGGHLRVADARWQRVAHRPRLLDLLRDLRGRLRDGDVLHAVLDRVDRARRVVARPRRPDRRPPVRGGAWLACS